MASRGAAINQLWPEFSSDFSKFKQKNNYAHIINETAIQLYYYYNIKTYELYVNTCSNKYVTTFFIHFQLNCPLLYDIIIIDFCLNVYGFIVFTRYPI